jgi:hypothetical protein
MNVELKNAFIMKRINDEIYYNRLDKFENLIHPLSIANKDFEADWICLYEHVNLYTNNNNSILAFKYHHHGLVFCYEKIKETNDTRALLKSNHPYMKKIIPDIDGFDAYQNCLGFCLNIKLWINLNENNLNQILTDDDYREFEGPDMLKEHFIVYYLDNRPMHITKYDITKKEYLHKLGCGLLISKKDEDIEYYSYNQKRYFYTDSIQR